MNTNDIVKNTGILLVSASAVVASSVYVYSSIVRDNTVQVKEETQKTTSATPTVAKTVSYKDGTYKAAGDYDTNNKTLHHEMLVTVTLAGGKVTAATTELLNEEPASKAVESNKKFSAELKNVVVGKNVTEVASVEKVSGSSDTTRGFKEAVEKVMAQAKIES